MAYSYVACCDLPLQRCTSSCLLFLAMVNSHIIELYHVFSTALMIMLNLKKLHSSDARPLSQLSQKTLSHLQCSMYRPPKGFIVSFQEYLMFFYVLRNTITLGICLPRTRAKSTFYFFLDSGGKYQNE